jgi:hypothetical protein
LCVKLEINQGYDLRRLHSTLSQLFPILLTNACLFCEQTNEDDSTIALSVANLKYLTSKSVNRRGAKTKDLLTIPLFWNTPLGRWVVNERTAFIFEYGY